jgi:hypothetical protein
MMRTRAVLSNRKRIAAGLSDSAGAWEAGEWCFPDGSTSVAAVYQLYGATSSSVTSGKWSEAMHWMFAHEDVIDCKQTEISRKGSQSLCARACDPDYNACAATLSDIIDRKS